MHCRRIASAVALMLLVAFVVQFAVPSRSAAAQAEPVLQTAEARQAWGYLENEAETLLASQGQSSEMSETQARSLIRSYIFVRLAGIINKHTTPRDEAALNYLQTLVIGEQYDSAFDAQQTWNLWAANELKCPNGSLKWLVWEGGNAACGFWQLFGEHPNESQFTAAGFNDLWSSFSESGNSQAAGGLNDMVAGTTYWGAIGAGLPSGLSAEALYAARVVHEVIKESFGSAVHEFLIAFASSIVSLIRNKPDPATLVALGVAAAVIAANASWNAYDVSNIAEGLQKEVKAKEPASNPTPEMSLLTQSPGIAELAYVVASQTLGGVTNAASPCSYEPSGGASCYTYTFNGDPDFQQAIYGSTSPPQSNTAPYFQLKELEGQNKGATCYSQTVEPESSCGAGGPNAMPMWHTSAVEGGSTKQVNADLTSARGVGPTDPVDGYTSYLDNNGMFVTRLVEPVVRDHSWLYRPSVGYEAPDGTRWQAWYQNGSFLQVKLAAPLAGNVWTAYRANDVGGKLCEETANWFPDFYEAIPTGELCLLESTGSATGGQATLQNLSGGDELMALGARAVVKEVVGCWKNSSAYLFRGIVNEPHCNGNDKAAVLEPGQTKLGSAFSWQNLVSDITGLGQLVDPFNFSPEDPHAWLVTQLDTCAGRTRATCKSPSSEIENCNLKVTKNAAQPWSSTTCFRSSAITYRLANNSEWEAQVITPPAAVAHQYQADANNSAFSCCTSSQLVVPAAEGVFVGSGVSTPPPANISVSVVHQPADGTLTLHTDGSFEYTPQSLFGWSAPANDTFTYEICNSTPNFPSFESPCSEATVTITVRQQPPMAKAVAISANRAPTRNGYLYVASYKYSDRQGTPEGATTFAWYRDNEFTGVTGAEYKIRAGEEGDTITATVTPSARNGIVGGPATSEPITIGSANITYFDAPVSDTVTCTPTPLYSPESPPMSTTCTATATFVSDKNYTSSPTVRGTVSFRSLVEGGFGASSPPKATATCTLANKRIISVVGEAETAAESCSVSYVPLITGSAGVVGQFSYSFPGTVGNPGSFGTIGDYQTATVPVEQSGPGDAVRFRVTGLSNATGGTPQTLTVTALEGYGMPAPGFTGTIHLTSSDPNAVLPADYTFTSLDQGTHTFTGVTLNKANPGGTTVTATDTALPAITGSQQVTISVGPPVKLVISGFKYTMQGGVTAGSPQQVTVTAEDAGGNVVTGYTGTVHFTSTDPKATVPASYTFTSQDAGSHTFAAGELVLKTASGVTVSVTDGTISDSVNLTVDAAATSQLNVAFETLQPVAAGESRTIIVTAEDPYGNPTPFYTGTVSFSSTDSSATLPSSYTFTDTGNGDFGVHFFEHVVLRTTGPQAITVKEDGLNSSVKGTLPVTVESASFGSPAVTTGPAENVTASGATLPATVNPEGSEVDKEHCFFVVFGGGDEEKEIECEITVGLNGDTPQRVSARATELEPGVTYAFYIVAQNAKGTSSGSNVGFTTHSQALATREKLTPGIVFPGGGFGESAALAGSGLAALVGDPTGYAGAVWAFTSTGSSWTQGGEELKAPNSLPGPDPCFGCSASVSADGNYAIVGAPVTSPEQTGAAYIYVRSGASWVKQRKLLPTGEPRHTEFGRSVAISGDGSTVIVGGPEADSHAGRAWVFTRSGSSWSEQAELSGAGETGAAQFGASVAVSRDGETALAGGNFDNLGAGAAWFFTRSGSSWNQQGSKVSGASHSSLGKSVALSARGGTAVIGAPGASGGAGEAQVYVRSGSTWKQQATLTSIGSAGLGSAVALSEGGNITLIGEPEVNLQEGAAWVFERSGSSWTAREELKGMEGADAGFGKALSLSATGAVALVGSPLEGSGTGAAWIFR